MLSDVIMPKMSGPELRGHVVKVRPDVKVLLMSGYTDGTIARNTDLEADQPIFEKPFTPESLLGKVRESMDAK